MKRLVYLATRNLKRRQLQSITSVAITAVVIFIFTIAYASIGTIKEGMALSKERLGADCVLVPKYASVKGEDLLFTAAPENIYMDTQVWNHVESLGHYKEITPQFYCQTLSLSCCEPGEAVRIIGFDSKTDFILPPHLKYDTAYNGDYEIVLGSGFDDNLIGSNYLILGEKFFPTNQLQATGTGMDDTIFINMDVARRLCKEHFILSKDWVDKDPFSKISVIMVALDDNTSPEMYEKLIQENNVDARLVVTGETIRSMQDQTINLINIFIGIWIALLFVSILSIYSRFSTLARERRKEIGLLGALGVTRKEIFFLIFVECTLVAFVGGLIGVVLGIIVSPYAIGYLKDIFRLSESLWTVSLAIKTGLIGLLLGVLIGSISAFYPSWKSASMQPHEAMSQGEI